MSPWRREGALARSTGLERGLNPYALTGQAVRRREWWAGWDETDAAMARADPQPEVRPEGFYWVRMVRDDWEVAQWRDGLWWSAGCDVPETGEDFFEVGSGRLEPPAP